MARYEVLLLNTATPQIEAAQSGDTYLIPRTAEVASGANLLLYNTADMDTNYERGGLRWNTNELSLIAEAGGTGTGRNITISPGTSGGTIKFIPVGGGSQVYIAPNTRTIYANGGMTIGNSGISVTLNSSGRHAKITDVSSGTDTAYETAINEIIDALEAHGLSATS